MDKLAFWKQKIVQALHDPPAKPYASYPGAGGHVKVAGRLFKELTGEDFKYYKKPPDWAAAGADRPVTSPPRGSAQIQLKWPSNPILTHPLCPGARILANRLGQETPSAGADAREIYLEEEFEAAGQLVEPLPEWENEHELQSHFLRIWRQFRHALISDGQERRSDPLVWQEMPADSRCPDHSIWDHLKVTSSLAFLDHRANPDPAQDPWMLRFGIGGVQRFIEESRTSRDLWVSSFLIADLIWEAMIPIVERYGPDAIVYPDLRGNPRVDAWLNEAESDALPEETDFGTYAAVLPNAFTALVPRGGPGHSFLVPLQELAQEAESRVAQRWTALGKLVKDWFETGSGCGKGHWQEIWDRQQTQILHCSWTAIEWRRLEKIQDAKSLSGQAMLADQQVIQRREDWLRPFVDAEAWGQYEDARRVYAATNLTIHQCERGFDYAVTHHQLLQRNIMRRRNGDSLEATPEPGEKCSLCGRRQALTNHPPDMGLHKARRHANEFWKRTSLNPDPGSTERLCAVCASKRFLVESGIDRQGRKLTGINPLWAGREPFETLADQDGRVRVPFPSTAMLAAQEFLAALVQSVECRDLLSRVVKAHEKARLPKTSFARSLKSLARHSESESRVVREFLKLDTQAVLFPQTLTKAIDQAREENEGDAAALEDLQKAVEALLNKASTVLASGRPKTGFGVIRLDGDSISRLLLGDAEIVQTCWEDVLHPEAVKKLRGNPRTKEAGWDELLEAKRLLGPSLHAFVSRALAAFAHRIVPWVVESEFPGRLIYCGGDDILCLAPAEHALPMAARLQQLFSAAWVIDTRPEQQSWYWRRKDSAEHYDPKKARRRFLVPRTDEVIQFPIKLNRLKPHVCGGTAKQAPDPDSCELLPMLGHSLSCGIAYGHYKTSLRLMLRQSKDMIDLAKDQTGKSAIGLSHFSRNGVKTGYALHWHLDEVKGAAHQLFQDVQDGFGASAQEGIGSADGRPSRSLPGRLPYKLRESAPMLEALLSDESIEEEGRTRLLDGFFRQALEGDLETTKGAASAFQLWINGLELTQSQGWPLDRAVDGLLLARMLARGGEEEE